MDSLSDVEYSETCRLLRPDLCGREGPEPLGEEEIPVVLLLGVVGRVGGRLICRGRVVFGDGGP